jgi:putative ABC transport system permease protein
MMRPRWRKVLHDLSDNRLRTILVVVSIAVGVFAVGVITGTYFIISKDMSASYAANNPMNVELRTSAFDAEMLDTVENMRHIREAEGRRVFSARVRPAGEGAWTALDIVAIEDFDGLRINLLRPVAGLTKPSKKQILLEREAVQILGLGPGDVLEIELADGTIRSLPVAGIVQDPTTGAGDFLAPPLAYVSTDSLAYLHQPESFNRMFVVLSDGQNDADRLRQMSAEIKDKLEINGIQVTYTQASKSAEHPMSSTVQGILGILLALGVLVLFLSGSLIANTLSALLNQHLRHIGVMKLVGGRPSQIVALYIALIIAYCGLALLLAVPLGAQGAYGLSAFIADKLNFGLQGYRVVPQAFAIQVLVGLAVPLLVGLAPVRKGSRITVQRALSNDSLQPAAQPVDSGRIGGVRRRVNRLFESAARRSMHVPRPLLISLRNTFRRRGRLALTLFTLTMGGAIFIAVFNVRTTLHEYIGQIGRYFLADVSLEFDLPYRVEKVEQDALQVPGVASVEGWAFTTAEVLYPDDTTAENLTILAPPAESQLVAPTLLAGRWLRPGDEQAVALAEGILDKFPDLEAGDSLRLKVDGREADWTVVGIFEFTSQQGMIAYGTYEYISQLTDLPNRSVSFRIVTDEHGAAYQETVSQQLDQHFRDLNYHVREARTGKSTLQTASESLDILVAFLLVMAVLTALVGSMGLAGSMSMNVLERTREIGVMRSIGADDREVVRTVVVEGVVIGGLSWLMAVLLAFPITYLLSYILSLAIFNSMIDVRFTLAGFGLWLLVVLALSALASALPARNAARLTIREVLAYE